MPFYQNATATIGGSDHFELYGVTISMRDGALVNRAGSLAGAHADLATCLANAVRHAGLSLDEAYRMAAMVPLDARALARPVLYSGMPVDEIVALDDHLQRRPL